MLEERGDSIIVGREKGRWRLYPRLGKDGDHFPWKKGKNGLKGDQDHFATRGKRKVLAEWGGVREVLKRKEGFSNFGKEEKRCDSYAKKQW